MEGKVQGEVVTLVAHSYGGYEWERHWSKLAQNLSWEAVVQGDSKVSLCQYSEDLEEFVYTMTEVRGDASKVQEAGSMEQ